jgi:hypothetical protein
MASLTESILTYSDNNNNNNNNNNNENNTWYNNVYLCIEKKGTDQYINGFNCYTFASFNRADDFYKKKFENKQRRHTMIPVCKWIPIIFHKYYLNYSLKKLYWKNDTTIFKNVKYI